MEVCNEVANARRTRPCSVVSIRGLGFASETCGSLPHGWIGELGIHASYCERLREDQEGGTPLKLHWAGFTANQSVTGAIVVA